MTLALSLSPFYLANHNNHPTYCYLFLGFPQKIKKIQKNTHQKNIFEKNKKKIGVRKGCWNYQKMARNWLRRFRNIRIEI
jgi:hypothetical protein